LATSGLPVCPPTGIQGLPFVPFTFAFRNQSIHHRLGNGRRSGQTSFNVSDSNGKPLRITNRGLRIVRSSVSGLPSNDANSG
jgi:hypothetical protein